MYSEKIMEEFLEPKNYGVIKGASGVGKVVSDVGSEIVKIFIKVEDDKIVDCQFQTFGGVVAIALSSIATTLMKDKTIEELKNLTASSILEVSGDIPDNKSYLVGVVLSAMQKSIENYQNKSGGEE